MLDIPNYLLFLTGTLVIVPTILAIILRVSLYWQLTVEIKELRELIAPEGNPKPATNKKSTFIKKLEGRFSDASSKLEQANTGALIDQIYSGLKIYNEIKIKKFSLSLVWPSREGVDYFCRVLPNLLLAFGLMGTFLGITINLVSLSATITQAGASDINSLVNALQRPLEGMGIAFTTSLAGLVCSALLTIANLIWNTTLAKYELVSLLEDYLDNIYQPTLQGQTRLDVIVKNMAATFDNFLIRFGDTVREGIESALAEKMEEIMAANLRAATLAEQVYSRLADASGTIATGADRLHISADIFAKAANTIQSSNFAQKLSEAVIRLDNIQNNFANNVHNFVKVEGDFSESITNLMAITTSLGQSLKQIDMLDREMVSLLSKMSDSQDKSLKILQSIVASNLQLSTPINLLGQTSKNTHKIDKNISSLGMLNIGGDLQLSKIINLLDQVSNATNEIVCLQKDGQNTLAMLIKEVSKEIQDSVKEVRELRQVLAYIVWQAAKQEKV